MKLIFVSLFFFNVMYVNAQKEVKEKPSWVDNSQSNDKYVYGIGIESSTNLSIAKEKAEIEAKKNIAEQIGIIVTTFTNKIDTIFKNDEQYIKTTKTIKTSVSAEFSGVEFKESDYVLQGGKYDYYMLLQLKRTLLKQSFMDKVDADVILKEKLMKAKVYNDLKKIK